MTILPLDAARLNEALDALAARDEHIARALRRVGYPVPRVREPGFATLLRIVAAQQISTTASAAIWGRLEQRLGGSVCAEGFLALGDADLRACGFSLRKAEYGRALAQAIASGELALEALAHLPEDEAVAAITALRGFGRWSAEIYLLFALGRIDVMPAGDLALQVGAQRLKGLEARPSDTGLRALAEQWRPWRGAAAIFLWHFYGAASLDEEPAAAAGGAGRRPP
ncbi:DNA-3-methyladenine glycosylase family protein [Marinimicrococcus flavescens]|uniref:DNA-3-methyladenine glycosylase II n=1 Tax=Marinimicrococcus flavescens TaxID=3031815 RepID=A0AAP3UXA8_9PROT|nr:DNA-3-methyladenine glycosylase 2 family protein [Marinimicrococcus flavescens]